MADRHYLIVTTLGRIKAWAYVKSLWRV